MSSTKLDTPGLEQLLREKYPRDKYALLFDVPDAVSLDAKRRIDAIAFGCWASLGRTVEGFELKASRADWLKELKQAAKADRFVELCDRFWLVTADASIAKLGEIPPCWGWMAATKGGLRIMRPAPKLPGVGNAFPRDFVIGVMRRLQDDLIGSPDVRVHIAAKVKDVTDRVESDIRSATRMARDRLEKLQEAIREFEKASGIEFQTYSMGSIGHIVGQLRKLGWGEDGGLNAVTTLLEGHSNALRVTLRQVDGVRSALASAQKTDAELSVLGLKREDFARHEVPE